MKSQQRFHAKTSWFLRPFLLHFISHENINKIIFLSDMCTLEIWKLRQQTLYGWRNKYKTI